MWTLENLICKFNFGTQVPNQTFMYNIITNYSSYNTKGTKIFHFLIGASAEHNGLTLESWLIVYIYRCGWSTQNGDDNLLIHTNVHTFVQSRATLYKDFVAYQQFHSLWNGKYSIQKLVLFLGDKLFKKN